MKNTYEITDLVHVSFDYSYLDDIIKRVLEHEKVENAYFSVIFVSAKEIKIINKKYRKVDAVTDVISFAFEDVKDNINSNCYNVT